jgi:hypothetical protein
MNNMLGGEAKQIPLDSRYTAVLIKTPKQSLETYSFCSVFLLLLLLFLSFCKT